MKFRLQETYVPTPLHEDVDRNTNRQAKLSEEIAPVAGESAATPATSAVTNKSDIADVHKDVELIDEELDNKQLTEADDKHIDGDEEDTEASVEIGDEAMLDTDVDESDLDFLMDDTEPTEEEEVADVDLDGLDDADIDTAPANAGTGIAEEIRTVMSSITDNISALNQLMVDVKAYNAEETVEKVLNSIIGNENRTLGELQGLLLAFDVPAQAAYEGIEAVSNEVAEAGIAASSLDETPAVFDDDDMSEEDMNSYLDIAENFDTLDV